MERLIGELWGQAPARAAKMVQGYVSQVRRSLGDGLLVTRGYVLQTASGQVELDRSTGWSPTVAGRCKRVMRGLEVSGCATDWRFGAGHPLADFS